MEHNPFSNSSSNYWIIPEGDQSFINMPIAGIFNRRLESERYKRYKKISIFNIFKNLYQSETLQKNSKFATIDAGKLWKDVPKDFKNTLQQYCDKLNEERMKEPKGLSIKFNKKDYSKQSKRTRKVKGKSERPLVKPLETEQEKVINYQESCYNISAPFELVNSSYYWAIKAARADMP